MMHIDRFNSNSTKVLVFYVLLMGLIILESFNIWNSKYIPNSIHYSGTLIFCMLFIHVILVPLIQRVKFIRWILLALSLVSVVMVFRIVLNWNFSFAPSIQQLGFQKQDIGMFRAWFRAYGWVINEWSAVLIGLLPLITLTSIYFRKWRLHLTIVTGIIIAGILLTGSRGALVAMISFYSVFLISICYFLHDRLNIGKKILQLGGASLIVVSILIIPNYASIDRLNPFSTSVSVERSDQGRITAYNSSMHLIRESLWLGAGSGNYALVSNVINPQGKDTFRARVNSSYLELLVERGFLGLLFYAISGILLLWYVVDKLRKSRTRSDVLYYSCILAGIIAVLVREVTFSSIFHNPILLCLFFFVIHLGLRDIFEQAKNNQHILRKFYLGSVVTLGVLVILSMVHWWVTQDHNKMIQLLNENKIEKAEERFDDISSFSKLNINYALAQTILSKDVLLQDHDRGFDSLEHVSVTTAIADPAVFFNLGYRNWKQGKLQKAKHNLTNATKWSFSGMYDAALSKFHFERGQDKEAQNALISGIQKQPDLLLSPYMDTVKIQYPESYDIIRTSLRNSLGGSYASNILKLAQKAAMLIYLDNNFLEAQTILEDVSRALPNLSRVWYNLALCYQNNNNYEEAINAARKAEFLSPADYLPKVLLAELYTTDRKVALQYYERALFLYFNLPTTRSKYADYLYKSSTNIRYESITPSWVMVTRPKIDLERICDSLTKMYLLEGKAINTELLDTIRNSPSDLLFEFDPALLERDGIVQSIRDTLYESASNFFLSQYPEYISSSPDLSHSLFKTRWLDSFELTIRKTGENAFTSLDISDRTQLSLTWHPNNYEIYFQEYDQVVKGYHLFSIDTHSGERIKLLCPPSSSAIPPLRFSPKGRFMAFLSTGHENTLWLYDCESDEIASKIATCADRDVDFHWVSDSVLYFIQNSDRAILSRYSMNGSIIDTINMSSKSEIKSFAVIEDTIYCVLRERDSSYSQLFRFDLSSHEKKRLTTESINIEEVSILPSGEVIYEQNEKGVHRILSLHDELNEKLMEATYVNVDSDQTNYILTRENFNNPRSVWHLKNKDTENESMQEYYAPVNSYESSFAKSKYLRNNIYDHDFEVYTWDSKIDVSSNKQRVVLYVHGGPHIQEDMGWDPMVQFFTTNGYSFVKVNYSGSTGYTREYEKSSGIGKQATDIVSTLKFLKTRYDIPFENIYMVASSYGSIPTFAALKTLPQKIGGLVCISGAIPQNLDNWPITLPINQFRVYYGADDPLAGEGYDFLKQNNISLSSTLSLFKGEGHYFHKTSSWAHICRDVLRLMEDNDKRNDGKKIY